MGVVSVRDNKVLPALVVASSDTALCDVGLELESLFASVEEWIGIDVSVMTIDVANVVDGLLISRRLVVD